MGLRIQKSLGKMSRRPHRFWAIRALVPSVALASSLCIGGAVQDNVYASTKLHGALKAEVNRTLVALGDSITFGYNLGDNKAPSPLAFPYLVGKKENLDVMDLGVPGWTSGDLLKALQTADFQNAVKTASVITLDIGSNDLLQAAAPLLKQAASQAPPQVTADDLARLNAAILQFQKNLPAIVNGIRQVSTAPIVMVNLYDPMPDQSPLHNLTEQVIAKENQIITAVAASTGCTLANAYASFNHQQWTLVRVLQKDVHPTAEGQVALATVVEAAIEQPLKFRPVYFATAPQGTAVRMSPFPHAPAIYYLHGVEGDLVVGQQGNWLQVVTGNKKTGYVSTDRVNLLLRPTGNFTFSDAVADVRKATLKSSTGAQTQGLERDGILYAPVSFLARAAGCSLTWDNVNREVTVSSGSASANPTSTNGNGGAEMSEIQITATLGTERTTAKVRTEGILVTIDGEPLVTAGEAFIANGSVYVPMADFAKALGGTATPAPDGLQLLFRVGS